MDVDVIIDTDEWYPVYSPDKYENYHRNNNKPKIAVDQSLLDRWDTCLAEFHALQDIFFGLSKMQK